jgi:NAD(P)-dependent dehydrogenase (short-subunit alcohol dehydrogenase family)
MGLLDGKVAVVTGAGRGIGRGHARLLATEGARVVVNDLGTATAGEGTDSTPAHEVVDEIVAAGGQASVNGDNVATRDGRPPGRQAIDEYGRSTRRQQRRILRDDELQHHRSRMGLGDSGAPEEHMAMCHHAVKHWRALGKAGEDVSGRIINTASESGLYGQAGQVNYSAAKAGIVSMTIVIAREMKKYGVTANVVCPRALTRMTATVVGAEEFMQGPEWAPENISPIVAFLASDAAADVSGQIFVVFGTRVHLMEGFTLVNTLDRGEGRWTPEELIARKDDLFAGRRSGVPPMGFGQ